MNLTVWLGHTGVRAYYALLVLNGLIAITCLAAGPRRWARRLCAITSQLNILPIICIVGAGKAGAIENEAFGASLVALLPLVAELLALLAISRWRLRDHRLPLFPS